MRPPEFRAATPDSGPAAAAGPPNDGFRTAAAHSGMSTVPEVLVARHLGMRILAIATVTDMATGIPGQIEHVTGEQVLEVAARAGERLGRLVTGVVAKL